MHAPLRRILAGSAAPLLAALALGCGDGAEPVGDVRRDPAAEDAGAPSAAVAFRVPGEEEIPDGDLGASIRRGRALLSATRDSLPGHVGNELRCTTCHLFDGTKPDGMPWVGVYANFPEYRTRNARVNTLEDRVNDCFERSMNGTPLPVDGPEMRDIVAYMAFLSRGIPVGAEVEGRGLPDLEPLEGDSARGAEVFASACVACHGADGQGTPVAPALWGPDSYNIGAGMARVRTAASFIRHNMPLGIENLSDQQAFDVATYINAMPRPDFPGKENDWPLGNPPPDAAYPTAAARSGDASD